jgi:hypothetical protein
LRSITNAGTYFQGFTNEGPTATSSGFTTWSDDTSYCIYIQLTI